MNNKAFSEYIAYKGEKFTVEWYFDENGRSQALEYANGLEEKDISKLMTLLKVIGDSGVIRNEQNSAMRAIRYTP